jgi:hypothetical protein
MMREGWLFRVTRLTEEFTADHWREKRPDAVLIARVSASGDIRFIRRDDQIKGAPDVQIISMLPPGSLESEASKVRPNLPDDLPA